MMHVDCCHSDWSSACSSPVDMVGRVERGLTAVVDGGLGVVAVMVVGRAVLAGAMAAIVEVAVAVVRAGRAAGLEGGATVAAFRGAATIAAVDPIRGRGIGFSLGLL